jgi:hypothetical protein
MSMRFFAGAFAAGLLVLAWVALGFAGTNPLALAVTVLIGGAYLLGAWELRQYRAVTHGLTRALDTLPAGLSHLGEWLAQVPASLRETVRLRVESGRGPLPGPALVPYLVGLLVMLGMLGTFLGMVATFRGTVFALEGSTDLQSMRAALAAPIKGLGLAFGTSVAGVAASAMLGLMSALARRERMQAASRLDACIGSALRPFTIAHQRQETARAVLAQADALPVVAERLQALMDRIDARSRDLDAQLLARHEQLQQGLLQAHAELARSVGEALQDSLAAGARAAGQAIEPVVTATMAGLTDTFTRRSGELLASLEDRQARAAEAVGRTDAQRLTAWTAALQDTSAQLKSEWERTGRLATERQQATFDALTTTAGEAVAQARAESERTLAGLSELLQASRESLAARDAAEDRALASREACERQALAAQAERLEALAATWSRELAALRDQEATRAQAAADRLDGLQEAAATHLARLGASLEAPMGRLMKTAAEVPQAAGAVIARLREEMARLSEREDLALRERSELLSHMRDMLQAVQRTTDGQRTAVEALVDGAAAVMEQAAARFSDALDAQAQRAASASAQSGSTAVELASMAEAFAQGVQLFQATGERLVAGLERIDGSLERATARSDEQMAYYVAQAREVIDLSIASQQGLVESLRELKARPRRAQALPEGVDA